MGARRSPRPHPQSNPTVDLKLEDPAVRSVLGANPTKPAELVRAITVLVDLDRAELARPLLAKLLNQNLKPKALVALANQFDTAVLMKLASNEQLAPQGAQLADAVLSAAARWRRDPAQIEAAIAQLADAKEGIRRQAMHRLQAASDAAVGPLLGALADPRRSAVHPAALLVLAQLGPEAAGPLSAALQSTNTAIALAAVKALGQARATSATGDVLVLAFTGDEKSPLRVAAGQSLAQILGHPATAGEAREFLVSDIGRLLDQARKERAVSQPMATTWRWDEKHLAGVEVALPPADLAVETAARYAQALRSVAQGLADQRLVVRAELMAAKYLSPDHPLPSGPGTPRTDSMVMSPARWCSWRSDGILGAAQAPGPFAVLVSCLPCGPRIPDSAGGGDVGDGCTWRAPEGPDQAPETPPGHEPERLDHDDRRHLRLPGLAVDEADRHLGDGRTVLLGPVRHLDLEAVPLGPDAVEVEPPQDPCRVGPVPRRRVGHAETEDGRRVEVATL